MSKRRLLTVLALGILATAPTRVSASTEVEGAGYGGTTAGGWFCGPVGRANYGGVGARVRLAEQRAPFGGTGFTGDGAAAVERESTTIEGCNPNTSICERAATMFGAHARAGYQWEMFGFEAGATAFQGYSRPKDDAPTVAVLPDAEVSYGSHSALRGVLGIGSPTVTTLRRPGAYLGADVAAGFVDLEARAGVFRIGPALGDDVGGRADVAAYLHISEPLSLRLGASVSGGHDGLGGEGSAGIRCSL